MTTLLLLALLGGLLLARALKAEAKSRQHAEQFSSGLPTYGEFKQRARGTQP